MLLVGAIAAIYLLNPLGPIDLLPDFLPIVGNLDEATATAILLNVLRFYGYDRLLRLFGNPPLRRSDQVVEGEVVYSERVED
ncbi:MAG: YkvA family protein [Anaerolineae bacterium]|nr:YkvA family protein [Anaerolineae bacterium]